jgi:hypothetical protein
MDDGQQEREKEAPPASEQEALLPVDPGSTDSNVDIAAQPVEGSLPALLVAAGVWQASQDERKRRRLN